MATAPFAIGVVEGQTKTYSTTLLDEVDVAIPAAAFTGIRLTYYSLPSDVIINSRSNQDALNANNCTIHATSGLFEWKLQETDVIMVESPKPGIVTYRAVFVLEWDDAAAVARQMTREIDVTIQRSDNAPFSA